MFTKFMNWLVGVTVERNRGKGEYCLTCCYFADHHNPDDSPHEVDGYCCYDFVKGNTWNEYGGHWSHSKSWCGSWEKDDGENGWYPKENPFHSQAFLELSEAERAVSPSASEA